MTENDSKFVNKNGKAKIELDVTDWLAQYQDTEPDLTNFEAAIAHQQTTGAKPIEMGQLLIISRHVTGNDEILGAADKMLLNVGASVKWSGNIAKRKKPVILANGMTVQVREYVGTVSTDEPADEEGEVLEASLDDPLNGPEMANVISQEAAHRAVLYLQRYVPGYIRDRLEIIAANKGDVREAGQALIKFIEGVMTELE